MAKAVVIAAAARHLPGGDGVRAAGCRVKLCDITIAYNDSSGGIRTYIDEKRRYLRQQTGHEHLLIVPGAEDTVERGERSTVVSLAGPLLPGQDSYRFFARPGRVRSVLLEHRPDVVELGSYYLSPWAAFSYRQRLRAAGQGCVVGCYFHTDVAEAYVAAPLRGLARGLFEDWSGTLSSAGERIAALLAGATERYVGAIFAASDIVFAPSPAQAERLRGYGVAAGEVVPLGVDLELFHPGRRSEAIRARHGAGRETVVLVYAGRLSNEKRVPVLIEALARLPSNFAACLWITGHGPLLGEVAAAAAAIPALRLLPYQRSREQFAALLASADIYVTAGPHETFALSVIEAQAAGLPVVAVDAGALRERVPAGLGYLGPVDDPAAMAENIVKAAAERPQLAAQARAHVEARFGWDSTFRALLSCYERKLETLAPPPPSAAG